MMFGQYQLSVRCANHITCAEQAYFTGSDEETCKDKAKRAGWYIWLKRSGDRMIPECKCRNCKEFGR